MKKLIMAAGATLLISACGSPSGGNQQADAGNGNPFLSEYTTPFGVPPFDKIKLEHYMPAFLQGMEEQAKEIEAIVNNPAEPDFQNTIVAYDQSGALLRKVSAVFSGLSGANTNDEMQKISRELSPLQSKHRDDINLNPALFERVKSVYQNRASMNLDKEQLKLVEDVYKGFVRSGANLNADDQAKLRQLNSDLSMLQLTFGQNMLKETNAYQLVIENEEDLAGLPDNLIASAAEKAKDAGHVNKWVFTLQNPSVLPFLQYSEKRDLRKDIFNAYINRGNNNNENDNKEVVRELVAKRLEKAKLLGYDDYASFALEDRMAKNEKNVYNLSRRTLDSGFSYG